MDETRVVTVFLRNGADVLLLRRSDDVGSYSGLWGTVAGHAEGAPDAQAIAEIREETGIREDAVTFVRRGERFRVADGDLATEWVVTPYLFDVDHREIESNYETAAVAWVPPTEILRRDTVPDLWTSYSRVAPTVDTVREDDEHGSAYISIRALEVLRDAAAEAIERDVDTWSNLAEMAVELLDARPAMAAVQNRVNRALSVAAPTESPAALEDAATDAIEASLAADEAASAAAADLIDGDDVFTLSRSGTVLDALVEGGPERVSVAESRPGGEGVGVAETLAGAGIEVTLTSDANVPGAVRDATTCLIGADTVLPNGAIVNKVGSRAAGLAARDAGVSFYAAAASDKISPTDAVSLPEGDSPSLYDGPADLAVENPVFEHLPSRLLDGVVTEAGLLDSDQIAALASVHSTRARWREE
ncbi:MAG: NUDIX domain-containing protein [Halanaeroarchaeum sp.]